MDCGISRHTLTGWRTAFAATESLSVFPVCTVAPLLPTQPSCRR
jgi:predicted MFS family arabinose efflux permease